MYRGEAHAMRRITSSSVLAIAIFASACGASEAPSVANAGMETQDEPPSRRDDPPPAVEDGPLPGAPPLTPGIDGGSDGAIDGAVDGATDAGGGAAPAAIPFDDVSKSPHAEQILALAARGIAGACGPRAFCPDAGVLRRDAVTWVIRAKLGASFPYEPVARFSDVPQTDPAFAYVQKAAELGIVGGYPDGTFRPNTGIPRTTMAIVVVRALDGESFDFTQARWFADVDTTHDAFRYVQRARDRALTYGCGDVGPAQANFCVQSAATRGEIATVVARGFTPAK